ncbi:unnamed protein product [Durusdinium trenchii]|uniref:Uncharacterized protein n=1 Tax=Durusdinium trenchii TaxID=1381693 RepID=A0ABP0LUC7_9DINO
MRRTARRCTASSSPSSRSAAACVGGSGRFTTWSRSRSPLRVNDFETKRAIADREKPPPTKCTFRACKEADMRNHFKDYGIIESQSNPYHTPPEGNESGLLESHGPLLLPLPMRRSALRPHRRPTALGHFL